MIENRSVGAADIGVGAPSTSSFGRRTPPPAFNRIEDRQFLQMQEAYTRIGGLISGTEAAHRLRRRHEQPLSTLARWIVTRTIVSFEWRSHILVPLFQFDPGDMTLRQSVVEVMGELNGALDGRESAHWCTQPNTWLHDEAPVDTILHEPSLVLTAARADRFIARG